MSVPRMKAMNPKSFFEQLDNKQVLTEPTGFCSLGAESTHHRLLPREHLKAVQVLHMENCSKPIDVFYFYIIEADELPMIKTQPIICFWFLYNWSWWTTQDKNSNHTPSCPCSHLEEPMMQHNQSHVSLATVKKGHCELGGDQVVASTVVPCSQIVGDSKLSWHVSLMSFL